MQYNKINIDEQLRQIENQSEPELSKLDQHWEQFKNIKQIASPVSRIKLLRWVLVAATLIIFIVALVLKSRSSFTVESKPGNTGLSEQVIIPKDSTTQVKGVKPIDSVTRKNEWPEIKIPHTNTYTNLKKDWPVVPKTNKVATQGDLLVLDNFFRQLEKQAQEFIINNTRDTLIECVDGSTFFIKSGSFAAGKKVKVLIKEYYSYEDIVTNKLTTISNGELIESGGMIHISAEENGRAVFLAPGRKIRWILPYNVGDMNQMQLFTIARQDKQQTSYITEAVSETKDTLIDVSFNWIPQNQFFSKSVAETKNTTKEGKLLVSEKVEINNKVSTYQINKDKVDIREPLDTVTKKIRNNYAVVNSQNQDSGYTNGVKWYSYTISSKDSVALVGTTSSRTINNRYLKLDDLKDRYGVDLNNLGWINCDRFLYDSRPKLNYTIELNENCNGFTTMLVFDKIKSVMPGHIQNNRVFFPNVPEGETAKVIIVGIKNGNPVSAISQITISKEVLTNLVFEPISTEEFRKDISKMDE